MALAAIWKYALEIAPTQVLGVPAGARFLYVDMQGASPCLWAQVDPKAPEEPRTIRLITTGARFNSERLAYLGSFQLDHPAAHLGPFVGHLFEERA